MPEPRPKDPGPDDSELRELEAVTRDEILRRLDEAGFNEETFFLLHLVPLVQVAWADGEVTVRERTNVLQAARVHGIEEDSTAFRTLSGWLTTPPSDAFFERALEAIRTVMYQLKPPARAAAQQDLLSYCTAVATASGGLFGFGRISADEQAHLELIAAELQRNNEAAVREVLEKWRRIDEGPDLSAFL